MHESYRSSSISRLPEETLLIIFEELTLRPFSVVSSLLVPLTDVITEFQWSSVTLSHVCRYWHQVALQCPGLWSCITQFHCEDALEAFLNRSADFPLIVLYPELFIVKSNNTRLLISTLSHMSRIRILEIHGLQVHESTLHDWEIVGSLLNTPAPLMEHMSVTVRHDRFSAAWRTISWENIFDGSAPKLSFLRIDIGPISRVCLFSIAKRLSRLHLYRGSGNQQELLKISDLLRILSECPNLTKFTFSAIFSSEVDAMIESKRVDLPMLKSFSISGIQFLACQQLLTSICFPTTAVWSVDCDEYPIDHPAPFAPVLSQSIEGLACYALAILRLDIFEGIVFKTFPAQDKVGTYEHGHKLSLNLIRPRYATFTEVAEILRQTFRVRPEKVLLDFEREYSMDDFFVSEAHWKDFFDAIPDTHYLAIKFPSYPRCLKSVNNLLTAMTTVKSGTDQRAERHRLFRLKELKLTFCNRYQTHLNSDGLALQLIQCLKNRNEKGVYLTKLEVSLTIPISKKNSSELKGLVEYFSWEYKMTDYELSMEQGIFVSSNPT